MEMEPGAWAERVHPKNRLQEGGISEGRHRGQSEAVDDQGKAEEPVGSHLHSWEGGGWVDSCSLGRKAAEGQQPGTTVISTSWTTGPLGACMPAKGMDTPNAPAPQEPLYVPACQGPWHHQHLLCICLPGLHRHLKDPGGAPLSGAGGSSESLGVEKPRALLGGLAGQHHSTALAQQEAPSAAPSPEPHGLPQLFSRVFVWTLLALPVPSVLKSSGLTSLLLEQWLSVVTEASLSQSLNQRDQSRYAWAHLPPRSPELRSTGGELAARIRAKRVLRSQFKRAVCSWQANWGGMPLPSFTRRSLCPSHKPVCQCRLRG